MKVVIDTNILIGGADDESSVAFKIIKEVIRGRIEAFATHQTMSENRQMLRKLVRDREYRELLEEFFRRLKIVPPLKVRGGKGALLRDEEDIKLLESAGASSADYLVTKDNEVLNVEEHEGTEIVTPEEFWAKYKAADDDGSSWGDFAKMMMGN